MGLYKWCDLLRRPDSRVFRGLTCHLEPVELNTPEAPRGSNSLCEFSVYVSAGAIEADEFHSIEVTPWLHWHF